MGVLLYTLTSYTEAYTFIASIVLIEVRLALQTNRIGSLSVQFRTGNRGAIHTRGMDDQQDWIRLILPLAFQPGWFVVDLNCTEPIFVIASSQYLLVTLWVVCRCAVDVGVWVLIAMHWQS